MYMHLQAFHKTSLVVHTLYIVGSVALLASGSMSINIGNDEGKKVLLYLIDGELVFAAVGAWCDNHPLALSHQRTAEMIGIICLSPRPPPFWI